MGIKLCINRIDCRTSIVTDDNDNVKTNVNPVICAPQFLSLPGTAVTIRWLQILLFILCHRIKCPLSLKRTLCLIAKVLSQRIKCMLNDPLHLIRVRISHLSIFTLSSEESLPYRKVIIAHKTSLSGASLFHSLLMALLCCIDLS